MLSDQHSRSCSNRNKTYFVRTVLSSKEMPPLSVDSCTDSYNTTVSSECMAKLKENTDCNLDNTVWIKCAGISVITLTFQSKIIMDFFLNLCNKLLTICSQEPINSCLQ